MGRQSQVFLHHGFSYAMHFKLYYARIALLPILVMVKLYEVSHSLNFVDKLLLCFG